jgi:hypothetical protein
MIRRLSDLTITRQYRNTSTAARKVKPALGWDTETDSRTGTPILLCNSDGESLTIKPGDGEAVLRFLSRAKCARSLNTFYNLSFDASGVLKLLPPDVLKEIHTFTEATWGAYRIRYIPRKSLSIRHGTNTALFFDICQFYQSSLDTASRKYLGRGKLDLDSTQCATLPADEVKRYCVHDAVLCRDLTAHFMGLLHRIDIDVNKLYSCAYLSQSYFSRHCRLPVVKSPGVLSYALRSYAGGRFEVLKRGHFPGVHYADIASAYPFEIANLLDLDMGTWEWRREYDPTAYYAFVHCSARSDAPKSIVPVMRDGIRIYPGGKTSHIVLTKAEFDRLERYAREVVVFGAWHWYPIVKEKPFGIIRDLYARRKKLRADGDGLEHVIKIIMNSFYGKMIQVTTKKRRFGPSPLEYETTHETGSLFNPIYASIITANTRVRLYDALDDSTVAMATDSIISEREPVLDYGSDLGQWQRENTGEAVVVGSGVYALRGGIKPVTHLRGFRPEKKADLFNLLDAHRHDVKIPMATKRPVHIGEALRGILGLSQGDIGRFIDFDKDININFDSKRQWERPFRSCGDVLGGSMGSAIRELC